MADEPHPPVSLKTKVEFTGAKPLDVDRVLSTHAVSRFERVRIFLAVRTERLWDKALHLIETEREVGTGFNFAPVLFGLGILACFLAPQEPHILAPVMVAATAVGILWRLEWRGRLYLFLICLSLIALGMLAAKVQTLRAVTPQLERQVTAKLSGRVIATDQNRRGAPRYLIAPKAIEGLGREELPRRIRLSAASRHLPLLPGEWIEGLARLQPVSGPALVGGYDFSFFAVFEGIGGTGFFMGAPSRVVETGQCERGWQLKQEFTIGVNRVRIALERRIVAVLEGTAGSVAVALITGNRSLLKEETQQMLRDAGLAHILAISGLHMALVTLTVIWVVRLCLALSPQLAQFYPIKKWAVVAGFIAATIYLFISGTGVATQRAWIMISVMLLAVLMDRRAITMRSVAVSALVILAFDPKSLLSPGFQMSFAAVAALVSGYEAVDRWRLRRFVAYGPGREIGWWLRPVKAMFVYLGGITLTSLIAGGATAIFAAWHFMQVPVLGIVGNLLAMPVVALLVMPLALSSVLLVPFGYEQVALWPLAHAIGLVLDIARKVSEIAPPVITGHHSGAVLALAALALILLTLLKTRLRVVSVLPVGLMVLLAESEPVPHLVISENGRAVAAQTDAGKLVLLYPRRNAFVSGIWKKAWPVRNSDGAAGAALLPEAEACDKERCVFAVAGGLKVHLVYDPALLESSCQAADILVAPRLWWVNCRGRKPQLVLKRGDFERYGTHQLYLEPVEEAGRTSHTGADKGAAAATASEGMAKPPQLPGAVPAQAPQAFNIRVETALPPPTRPWHRTVAPKRSFLKRKGPDDRSGQTPKSHETKPHEIMNTKPIP